MKLQENRRDIRTVLHSGGPVLKVGFPAGKVVLRRAGDDLLIEGEDGSVVSAEDYFNQEAYPEVRPVLLFADGYVIDGLDLAMDDDTFIEVEGSGVGDYSDYAGSLITGLDRLNDLGTDYWAIRTPPAEDRYSEQPRREPGPEDTGNAMPEPRPSPPEPPAPPTPPEPPVPPTPDPPAPPIPPGPEPDPEPSGIAYSARAVLHAQDAGEQEIAQFSVNARAIFQTMTRSMARASQWQPAQCLSEVEYLGGDGENLLDFLPREDGTIVFTLTAAALAWLEGCTENYIEVYYKVTVNGQEYTMQVVVPRHGEFHSEDYTRNCRHGDMANSSLVHGEWHAGRCVEGTDSVYDVVSTNMNDEMTYDGRVENAIIHTGYDVAGAEGLWGSDTVTVNCHVAATAGKRTEIIARGADSAVSVDSERDGLGVVVASGGGEVTLEASGAYSTLTVTNTGEDGLGIDARDSSVTLDASGDNGSIAVVAAAGTALAADGAHVALDASGVQGDITLTGIRGVSGTDGASIALDASGFGGTVAVNALADDISAHAAGILADGGTGVTVKAGGTVTITAGGGEATAAAASGKSGIAIEGTNVTLSATASAGAAMGLGAFRSDAQPDAAGTNSLKAGDTARITAASTGAEAAGVSARDGGLNTLTAKTLDITATSGGSQTAYAYGVIAAGSNGDGDGVSQLSQNTLTSSGNTFIKGKSDGYAYGIRADGASNVVTTGGLLSVDLEGYRGPKGIATVNSESSHNKITAAAGLEITLTGHVSGADAIMAGEQGDVRYYGGTNEITAKYAKLDIESTGFSHGVYTRGGTNLLTLEGAEETSGNALEITVYGASRYPVSPERGPAQGTAGIEAASGANVEGTIPASNIVVNKGQGDIAIYSGYTRQDGGSRVKGADSDLSHGIYAGGNSASNTIDGGGRNIYVDTYGNGRFVSGITSYEGGANTVTNASLLDIQVENDFLHGLTWYRSIPGTYGIFSCSDTDVTVDGVDNVNVNVTSRTQPGSTGVSQYTVAAGAWMNANSISINTDTTRKNTITLAADSDSTITAGTWLSTTLTPETLIRIGGDHTERINVNITGRADEIDESPYDEGGQVKNPLRNVAAGMYGDFFSQGGGPNLDAKTVLKGEEVFFTIRGENETHAAAVWATYTCRHYVEAGTVTMNVSTGGNGDAHGMMADSSDNRWTIPGYGVVTADKVVMEIEAEGAGSAFGMKATNEKNQAFTTASGSTNTITSDGAINVIITAKAAAGQAFAMYADSPGWTAGDANANHIIGKSSSGTSDTITLNGDIYASGNGVNVIKTGSGDDVVAIAGSVTGGGNSISTGAGADSITITGDVSGGVKIDAGAGNDTITLNGAVSLNGLTVTGGEGYDTLVLAASTLQEFNDRYQTWLENEIAASRITADDLECIQVRGVSADDVAWLKALCQAKNIDYGQAPEPLSAGLYRMAEAMPPVDNDNGQEETMTYHDKRYNLQSLALLGDEASDAEGGRHAGDEPHAIGALMHPTGTDEHDASHLEGFEIGLPSALVLNTHGMSLDDLVGSLSPSEDAATLESYLADPAPMDMVCVATGVSQGQVYPDCLAYALPNDAMPSANEDALAYMLKGAFVA